MSQLPRWDDQFITDPTSDPIYDIGAAWTYNGTDDRMEFSGTLTVLAEIELLNSKNNTGIVEWNFNWENWGSVNNYEVLTFRAFGYMFTYGLGGISGTPFDWVALYPEEKSTGEMNNISSGGEDLIKRFGGPDDGTHTLKFVGSATDVSIYLDGSLKGVFPARAINKNMAVGGKFGTFTGPPPNYHLNSFEVKADASLPKAPTLLEPGLAGALNAAQEIIATVPASRLFVDLGTHAPGITGLSSVIYDPGGTPVAMAEDVGIPDRSGGTDGDYYLEVPAREVASDNRLVIKDEFVTANSVVITDTIGFDVLPSPSGQTGTVVEEDDLQCFFSMSDNSKQLGSNFASLVSDLKVVPLMYNYNADDNDQYMSEGTRLVLFNDDAFTTTNGELIFNSSATYPLILDLDLGKIYDIVELGHAGLVATNATVLMVDIYSKATPFTTNGIEGNLEYSQYPLQATGNLFEYLRNMPGGPALSFATRYLRFYIPNSTYINGGGSAGRNFGVEIDIRVQAQDTLDTLNDNAQFLQRPAAGGAFVAYPGGGVTQGDGQVKITLPGGIQLTSDERKFMSARFKADLTD